MDVLVRYKERLVQLAERLVAEETIEQEEFEKMFADIPDPRKDTHIRRRWTDRCSGGR
jgi:ATP-dependent Zn protease